MTGVGMDAIALGYNLLAIRAASGHAPVRQCSCRAYYDESLRDCSQRLPEKRRRLPTLPRVCSTIGAGGLNFSVRNGKRWNPATIATLVS